MQHEKLDVKRERRNEAKRKAQNRYRQDAWPLEILSGMGFILADEDAGLVDRSLSRSLRGKVYRAQKNR